jgi:hypothetical protein
VFLPRNGLDQGKKDMKVSILMNRPEHEKTARELMTQFGRALNVKAEGNLVTGNVHQKNCDALRDAVKLVNSQIDQNLPALELTF